MKYYKLNLEDFKRTFNFGVNYYIDPTKNTTGRTTSEPRGLGSILDAFNLGKLTEIGVEKILTEFSDEKNYILDFDIKSNSKAKDEPDIVAIKKQDKERSPLVFVEIKNTSFEDRWIGLTEEQFNTIKRSAESRNQEIYMIYASIRSSIIDENPKTADLTGMFLKEIEDRSKSTIFQKFADLNAECKIEFILSSNDLENFSYAFDIGMNMYETELFKEKKYKNIYNKDGIRKDVIHIDEYSNFDDKKELKINEDKKERKPEICEFNIKGSFKVIHKNKKRYIECISDVEINNNIFGKFSLKKGAIHDFNLNTLGRDPILKRNNLFIAKRRVYQLIEEKKIRPPEEVIKDIVKKI